MGELFILLTALPSKSPYTANTWPPASALFSVHSSITEQHTQRAAPEVLPAIIDPYISGQTTDASVGHLIPDATKSGETLSIPMQIVRGQIIRIR